MKRLNIRKKLPLFIFYIVVALIVADAVASAPIIFYKRKMGIHLPPLGTDKVSVLERQLSCIRELLPRDTIAGYMLGDWQEYEDFYYSLAPVKLQVGNDYDYLIISEGGESENRSPPPDPSYDLIRRCPKGIHLYRRRAD